jgi:endonuclease/exonuclease/phosphatase family metal-dependent hydrolase
MSYATSGGIRLTTTRRLRGASGNAERRGGVAIALFLIVNGVSACAVQPRMAVLPGISGDASSSVSGAGACRQVSGGSPVQVTWIVPDDPDHRQKLDAVCAAVGPVVVQTEPSAALRPAAQESRPPLVIVDWNTYLGRGNLEALILKLERGDFTGGTPVAHFALLLQEVFRRPILQFARQHAVSVVFAPTRRVQDEADDRGGAILATGPLDDISVVELPFEKQRRVALAARFGSIQLVNVHLDTSVGLLRGGPGAARRRQARALREAIARLPVPVIVAGDFNTWWGDDEPAIKELRQAFPDAGRLDKRETWRGPLRTGNRLDYVFAKGVDPPVVVRRLDHRFGSDHWPLIATMPTRTTPATIPR